MPALKTFDPTKGLPATDPAAWVPVPVAEGLDKPTADTLYPDKAATEAALATLSTRALDVRDYGAVGGGLGTTIAGAGLNLTDIRNDTGQDWLESTDSADLAAFYLTQAAAEATGRGILFPKDQYLFTCPGFVHSNVHIDLGGSTVTNTGTTWSRFARDTSVFAFGVFHPADLDGFASNGDEQTADNISLDDTEITNLTGTMPSVGDVLLIRTTAEVLNHISLGIPDYTTFNEVAAVDGTTVTLRYPMERAITDPIIVNYSTLTSLQTDYIGNGYPHRHYCTAHASLINGTIAATDRPAWWIQAMLGCDIDVRIHNPRGQGVYGNGINRSRVRVSGVVGGPGPIIELAIGSALSDVAVNLDYSGDPTNGSGGDASTEAVVRLNQWAEQITIRGRINAGTRPATEGIQLVECERNTIDLDLLTHGITGSGVLFAANTNDNRVRGRIDIGTGAGYYTRWISTSGENNELDNVTFAGTPTAQALRFQKADAGRAVNIYAPSGVVILDSGSSGNLVTGYVDGGLHNSGPMGSRIEIKTSSGSWPPADVILARTGDGAEAVGICYGTTITNTGAGAVRTRTLPASVPGMLVRAYRDNATHAFRVDPNGTETIGAGGAGKYIELQSDKAYVELRCNVAGHWVVAVERGTIGYEP